MIIKKFDLKNLFKASKAQTKSINILSKQILIQHKNNQILQGVTGSGKTFIIANVIQKIQKPTLVLVHNKTLAMQIYSELKALFPKNRVEYFVSNFDYFQPEAYLPSKDLYIGKDARQNVELDMMRMSATNSLLTHSDTIVVASVAAIFAEQNPKDYQSAFFEIRKNENITRRKILQFLIKSGYKRNNLDLMPGTFSAKGDLIKIMSGHTNTAYIRLDLLGDEVEEIALVDILNHRVIKKVLSVTIFPAKNYVAQQEKLKKSIERIKIELKERLAYLTKTNHLLEAQRLKQRIENDIENLTEYGYCSGIENYSFHLDLRNPKQRPYTLIDYFGDDFLTVIDESHITIPQIYGMYNTNLSRKKTLVEYGFRLPSAIDNRPLDFSEFQNLLKYTIFSSATPGNFELDLVNNKVVEQVVRPTGLLDPLISVLPTLNQIDQIISAIEKRKQNNEKVLITTLTKRMSEDLAGYLQKNGLKAVYLHSELKTLERSVIINDLRRGVYDCLVGVNLLREGLDIPEVSLICILDADKSGFLRDARSLIQTIGRAARNVNGEVYLFANSKSEAMNKAIKETNRRRQIQEEYNKVNHIIPTSIQKELPKMQIGNYEIKDIIKIKNSSKKSTNLKATQVVIEELEKEMLIQSKQLNFEQAAKIRDIIIDLKNN